MEEDATKIAEDADSLAQHPAAWAAVARSRLEGFFPSTAKFAALPVTTNGHPGNLS